MKKQIKAVWRTVIIAAFGVAIGFLGELMPDGLKSKVENWSTALGLSYLSIWIAATTLLVLVFLILVWKEAFKSAAPDEVLTGSPKIVQQGDKSIYIEKNDGPINIR